MAHGRLILRLAAFDACALFAAWYEAQWDFVRDLIDLAWARRTHFYPSFDASHLDVLYPSLLVMATCLLAALCVSNLRRNRYGRFGENAKRFLEATQHARAIDERLSSGKAIFDLPDKRKSPARAEAAPTLPRRPKPGRPPKSSK